MTRYKWKTNKKINKWQQIFIVLLSKIMNILQIIKFLKNYYILQKNLCKNLKIIGIMKFIRKTNFL